MAKIDLTPITNANNLSNINSNFTKLAAELNDKVLYRDNPFGEPNQMENSLDMNGNDILNGGVLDVTQLNINGQTVQPSNLVLDNALKIANNLSDLANPTAARSNIGLALVNNTADINKPISIAQQGGLDLKLSLTGGTLSGPLVVPTINGATAFSVRPTFQGNVPWDSGNLNLASPPAIGTTTPNNGVFNNLTVNTGLTIVGGYGGTNTTGNGSPGNIGEPMITDISPTAISNGVIFNAASIVVTPGDWDVSGNLFFNGTGASTNTIVGISLTSATVGATPTYTQLSISSPHVGNFNTPIVRISVAVNTTVFLIGLASFASGTMTAGGRLRARRMR